MSKPVASEYSASTATAHAAPAAKSACAIHADYVAFLSSQKQPTAEQLKRGELLLIQCKAEEGKKKGVPASVLGYMGTSYYS